MADLSRSGFISIVQDLPASGWAKEAAAYRGRVGPVTLAAGAVRAAAEAVKVALSRGDAVAAAKWIGAGLVVTDGALIKERRFVEELRPSIHVNDTRLLAALREALEDVSSATNGLLPPTVWARLRDIQCFAELYVATRASESSLVARFHENAGRALYAMLARTELAFAGLTLHSPTHYPARVDEMSKEALATAASYAIEAYNQVHRLDKTRFSSAPAEEKDLFHFDDDLVLATHLAELIDLEADVFRHGYACRMTGANAFEIAPPNDRFGMARALGYIRQNARAREHASEPVEAPRFEDLVQGFVTKLGEQLLPVRGTRIVLEIPLPAIELLAGLFAPEGVYAEEGQQLRRAASELLASPDDILRCELAPGFRVGDALRIQRVFRFFGSARLLRALRENIPAPVRHNSLVGAMKNEHMQAMLVAAGFGADAVERYLALMRWDSSRREHLDLQYTPFLRIGDVCAIPAMVAGFSNVVRNILVTSRVRLHPDGADNPVERIVATALTEAGAAVRMNFDYTHGDDTGEVDVLARVGTNVFALECKETIEPCSSFELRTTWDYLEKARTQLDRFRKAWQDPKFRELVCKKLGWPPVDAALATGIILSHRILAGASAGDHPIRPVWEIENFCRTGKSRMEMLGRSFEIPMRGAGPVRASDLIDYLSNDGAVYGPFWKSFRVEPVEWQFDATKLSLKRYGYSPLKHFAVSGVADPGSTAELVEVDEQVRISESASRANRDLAAFRSTKARYLCAVRRARRLLAARLALN